MDFDVMYKAMDSRDRRFDGRFFVAVKTTGIYCRPICPAPTPRRENTSFYRYAAVAELAGYRPCRRCRPEVSPDTAEWDTRADLVGRGLRLIAEGVVDEHGVSGLAGRLGVSERHLQRLFNAEIGATPGVMARSRRARLARQLLTESALPITHVAFAAGFSSVRAFNEAIQQVYKVTPSQLRRGARTSSRSLSLHLKHRRPFAAEELFRFLQTVCVPGVEDVTASEYRRAVPFGRTDAVIVLKPSADGVVLTIDTDEIGSLVPVIQRCRQLLDLDADPHAIDDHLARSMPLKAAVARRPGLRLPGSYDPFQTAVQTILSRGAKPGSSKQVAGRVARLGTPISRPEERLSHLFPTPSQLLAGDLDEVGVPKTKARAIRTLSAMLVQGSLAIDGSMDPLAASRALRSIPGVGERTGAVITSRVLRDPDAFPESTRQAFGAQAELTADQIEEWRPWRAYALMHLWAGV